MLRDRQRVMNQGFDAAPRQVRLQFAPRPVADDEQMVDVAGIALGRRVDRASREPLAVARGQDAALVGPAAQARQSRAENRRLQIVEP